MQQLSVFNDTSSPRSSQVTRTCCKSPTSCYSANQLGVLGEPRWETTQEAARESRQWETAFYQKWSLTSHSLTFSPQEAQISVCFQSDIWTEGTRKRKRKRSQDQLIWLLQGRYRLLDIKLKRKVIFGTEELNSSCPNFKQPVMEWTQVQFIQVLSLCADLKHFTGVFPSSATLCFLFSTFIWHVYILVTLQI